MVSVVHSVSQIGWGFVSMSPIDVVDVKGRLEVMHNPFDKWPHS